MMHYPFVRVWKVWVLQRFVFGVYIELFISGIGSEVRATPILGGVMEATGICSLYLSHVYTAISVLRLAPFS